MTALGSVTVPRSTVILLSPFPPVEESTIFNPLMLSTYMTLDGITIGTLTLALLFSSTVSVALLLTGSFGGNAEFVRCGKRGSPAADLSIQIFAATVYVPAFSFPFWLELSSAFPPLPLLFPLLSFLLVSCFLSPDGFLSPLVPLSGSLTSVLSEVFFALVKSTPSCRGTFQSSSRRVGNSVQFPNWYTPLLSSSFRYSFVILPIREAFPAVPV